MRDLNEFQDQYIDGATGSIAEEETTTEVSGTTKDEANQISTTVETTANITPTKKTYILDKNQKKSVIFNPATFLTAPHKPKIQCIDREKIRDFCEIGMEFLIDDNYKNKEAMNEYKGYVVVQNKFASFDSFPGVAEFIEDVLSTDKEDFIKMLWNHEKRLKATGTTRTFMDIYRLLHKKLSTRANLHRIIPAKVDDDYCQSCKLPKTEQHMLLTCIQKQDLWNAAFKKYLSNPKDPNCSSIFEDLSTLRLFKYYILHYHDKSTIYDFFATVIRFIWKAHWQQFFEQTPVVDEIVLNQIQKKLLKLSAYNSLC
ncbi:hypothetical protein G6F46_008352 [Rhizopus delemar]|uniref:Reverse transcriptase zinc-binding domain-containing protein n=2 Tax=Rhizopus TaxID=4842 RepID=A0A9P7CMH2_9FUNG|nr:hypothetical protein G6F55_007301 [Rhizopus delemar]KAG1540227.1 hypothetical protein G6F51_008652 [Rhizopus arrhizus]KAG1493256.1 hypothetical protein G6F54_008709 [Rhizopus delemar]KAG1509903.1 hypothetical protein G6F52_011032 [Rhizopus delemar]KAG1515730.1 hypothetical protein G6F53_002696 [Rhizopus delemar]